MSVLIVPIRLAGMPISSHDQANAGASVYVGGVADFRALGEASSGADTPYTTASVLNQPLGESITPASGIHLHWNLPAALRSGIAGTDGLVMPSVPNRWMVVRVTWPTGGGEPQYECSVLKSDLLSNDAPSASGPATTAPLPPAQVTAGCQLYQYLGDTTDSTATPMTPFTALGFGLGDFATFLPNCYNVFGTVDQPPAGTVSYCAIGWYDDLGNDPASPTYVQPDGTIGAAIPTTWVYAAPATPFSQSIYVGYWSGIDWNPDGSATYQSEIGWTLDGTLTFGNSPIEALSTLISTASDSEYTPGEIEQLVNALQTGKIGNAAQAGFAEQVAAAVFGTGFSHHAGGGEWSLVAADHSDLAGTVVNAAIDLGPLNAAQEAADDAQAALRNARSLMFIAWYLYQQNKGSSQSSNYYNLLGEQESVVHHAHKKLEKAQSALAGAQANAEQQAQAAGRTLRCSPRAHHSYPADHTLLFSGTGTPLPPDASARANLACVISDDLPKAGLSVPADFVDQSVMFTLPASSLPQFLPPTLDGNGGAVGVAALASSLVQSLACLDPQGAGGLTALIAADTSIPTDGNPALLNAALTQSNLVTQLGLLPTQTSTCESPVYTESALIALGVDQYSTGEDGNTVQNLGAPIMLAWECSISLPVGFNIVASGEQGSYSPTAIVDNYVWTADGLELEASSQMQLASGPWSWSGSVPLSPNITAALVSELQQLAGDPQLAKLAEPFTQETLLAQTISGFHRGLGMLTPSLQLPVFDPYGGDPSLATSVAQHVRSAPRFTPDVDNLYTPIRGGSVLLSKLVLIDEFGRAATIADGPINFPSTIQPADGQSSASFLPTIRLAQPSRLLFHPLDTPITASSGALGDTPVIGSDAIQGWIVPDLLNAGVSFYAPSGQAIGSLFAAPSPAAPTLWIPAPGIGTPDQDMATSFGTSAPVLLEIAQALIADGTSDYLAAMVAALETALQTIDPPITDTNTTSLLVGIPLAVVQAKLKLEVEGGILPSPKPVLGSDGNLHFQSYGVGAVQFPIGLGSPSDLADGLAGYFSLQGDVSSAYATFYSSGATGESGAVVQPVLGTPYVTAGDSDSAPETATVTMLVVPGSTVRATNGISPAATLTLRSETCKKALDAMAFSLLTAPVLLPMAPWQGIGPVPLLTPQDKAAQWQFVSTVGDSWQVNPVIAPTPPTRPFAPIRAVEGWLQWKDR